MVWMLFWVISSINLVILITELIVKLMKKRKLELKNYIILAGQLAKLVIAVILLVFLRGGINDVIVSLLCVVMGLCAAVCLISGIMTGSVVFTKKGLDSFQRVWRSIYLLCCLFVGGFTVYFELLYFWG